MTGYSFVRSITISATMLLAAACGLPPSDSAYQTRGTPESLLDISSEVVTLNTASPEDITDLSAWISRDQPTRAELNCDISGKHCRDAEKMLRKKGVPVSQGAYGAQAVTLVYERVITRDCDQRHVDNPNKYYNTNSPAFGCSVASNMIQHVTDKQEFVNPNTLDPASAARGVSTMQRANKPRPIVAPYRIDDSIVSKSKSQ